MNISRVGGSLSTVVNILIIVLVFGIIILIHELGHFLMCRWTGIGVTEFSIGMGPCIFKTQKGDTQYSIRCLPIGGYCMMLGEDEEVCDDERAFSNKPIWSRIAVIVAGPIFNFILAFFVSMLLIGLGGYLTSEINYVQEGSGAETAGLQEGDMITHINGNRIYDFREVTMFMQFYKSEEPVELTVLRNDEKMQVLVTPKFNQETGTYQMGLMGGYQVEGDYFVRTKADFLTNIQRSWLELRYWIKTTFVSLKQLITGNVGVNQVSGVVGMADVMNETMVEAKVTGGYLMVSLNVLNFMILISANLGVINLLPFPALDGGRLLFLLIELITRKPVPKEKEAVVHAIGFVILFILMILITFKDIRNLFV